VERAILATLPNPNCKRHAAIFHFARRLKGIPELRHEPASAMRSYFMEWWIRAVVLVEDKRADEAWRIFCSSWDRIRKPLAPGEGEATPEAAMAQVQREPLPPAAMAYCRQEVRLLVALCRKLQELVGDKSFYLSCRDAARLCCPGGDVEREGKTIWRWMDHLASESGRVLQRVSKGVASPKSGIASEWRYIGA
jgi:hypothetical protein